MLEDGQSRDECMKLQVPSPWQLKTKEIQETIWIKPAEEFDEEAVWLQNHPGKTPDADAVSTTPTGERLVRVWVGRWRREMRMVQQGEKSRVDNDGTSTMDQAFIDNQLRAASGFGGFSLPGQSPVNTSTRPKPLSQPTVLPARSAAAAGADAAVPQSPALLSPAPKQAVVAEDASPQVTPSPKAAEESPGSKGGRRGGGGGGGGLAKGSKVAKKAVGGGGRWRRRT